MNKGERKKIAYEVTFIVMAIYFSMLENFIPKPFPWMKIGFANIASVIGMDRFGGRFGIEVTVLRILIYGFMMGTFMTPNFIISFTAGLASSLIMAAFFRFKNRFSLVAISAAGGVVHNMIQLATAYFLFFRSIDVTERSVIAFIGIFGLIGLVSGIVVGVVSYKFRIVKKGV